MAFKSIFLCYNGIQVYLLVYVDDLIVTGSDASFISKCILDLFRPLKDLGALHHFQGVEARPAGIFLSQHK